MPATYKRKEQVVKHGVKKVINVSRMSTTLPDGGGEMKAVGWQITRRCVLVCLKIHTFIELTSAAKLSTFTQAQFVYFHFRKAFY